MAMPAKVALLQPSPGTSAAAPHRSRADERVGERSYVRDLARGQTEAGHKVGLVCDTTPVIPAGDALFEWCRLGIHPLPISRLRGAGDLVTAQRIARQLARLRPDIIHGHGAKGGLHARLAGRLIATPTVYTPHGGSLHYRWSSLDGVAYLGTERLLRGVTSGLIFVCSHERHVFDDLIGLGDQPFRVIHNGLWPEEFSPVLPDHDAADLLFIGELRWIKGADVLIEAVALAAPRRSLRLAIIGSGPDERSLRHLVRLKGVDHLVSFHGPLPVRQALRRGRLLVLPSRAEFVSLCDARDDGCRAPAHCQPDRRYSGTGPGRQPCDSG